MKLIAFLCFKAFKQLKAINHTYDKKNPIIESRV